MERQSSEIADVSKKDDNSADGKLDLRQRSNITDGEDEFGSEAPKDKVSLQEHAKPVQCQTSHGDTGQIHNKQADPDGEPVNSTLPSQTGNALATFGREASGDLSTVINSSPPSQTGNSAGESSNTESGTYPFLAGSQTQLDDDDGKKEASTKNDNNGVNKTKRADDDGKKETSTKNEVNETSPDELIREYKLVDALILGGQIISIAAAVLAKKTKSDMSNEAEFLLHVLLACLFVSLLSIVYGFCQSALQPRQSDLEPRQAAPVVKKIGMVMTAVAVVAAIGLQFPNELMIWVTLGVLVVSAPAIIGFAWKY